MVCRILRPTTDLSLRKKTLRRYAKIEIYMFHVIMNYAFILCKQQTTKKIYKADRFLRLCYTKNLCIVIDEI